MCRWPILMPVILTSLAAQVYGGPVDPFYVSDSANQLLRVDPETGDTTLQAALGAQMMDIGFGADGRLFGITSTYSYEIDPATGWTTLLGAHGFGGGYPGYGLDALSAGPDGTLYAAGNDILVAIDPRSGAGTRVGHLSGHRSAGDLALTPDGRLLLTTDLGMLVEVHQNGSGASVIGPLPHDDVWAFASDATGHLLGIRSTNEIVAIDIGTGHATVTSTLNADFLIGRAWGAAIPVQHVPEPGLLVFMVCGALLLLTRRGNKA